MITFYSNLKLRERERKKKNCKPDSDLLQACDLTFGQMVLVPQMLQLPQQPRVFCQIHHAFHIHLFSNHLKAMGNRDEENYSRKFRSPSMYIYIHISLIHNFFLQGLKIWAKFLHSKGNKLSFLCCTNNTQQPRLLT